MYVRRASYGSAPPLNCGVIRGLIASLWLAIRCAGRERIGTSWESQ
jgi:hypothetical protein